MNEYHGIEEHLPKPDFAELYANAISEASQERDTQIKNTIKGLFAELKQTEGEIKKLHKKKQKLEGRLKGYSLGQVQDAEA